jgi:hypothetical protein
MSKDLSVPTDMSKYLCPNAFACGGLCFAKSDQVACATACAGGLNTVSRPKFLALVNCVFSHCSEDGGDVTQACALGTISVTDAGPGACLSVLQTCQADTGK